MAPSILPIRPAKLLSSQDHLLPGQLKQTTFFFEVPLDYAAAASPANTIQLHAQRIVKHERPVFPAAADDAPAPEQPYLVYLEGGPGFGNRAPADHP
ncbi:hypothetical protein E4U42_001613, partial [Claviceps africana]